MVWQNKSAKTDLFQGQSAKESVYLNKQSFEHLDFSIKCLACENSNSPLFNYL